MFGGIQVFQIILNWARGKCVALLLGTEGMGISALFASSSNTIQKFSSLGLNLAVVREIADASNDDKSVPGIVVLSLKFIMLTSLLGALICIVFAHPLSRLTFGDSDKAWQFALLGVAVAFSIYGAGIQSVLQGMRLVRLLSKAALIGGLTGLFIGIPLYYVLGINGIVPAMIALSAAMLVFYVITLRKLGVGSFQSFSLRGNTQLIRRLLSVGLVLMAGDLIATALTYGVNLFIRTFGSVDEVGLYQAANSATAQYSGMIFAALAIDYFPRLTKASSDNKLMIGIVNRQTEIVSLIMAPAACLLILFAPVVILVLFSNEFNSILPLLRWMGLGIAFRALMLPMAYITFAKGNKKVYFCLEGLLCNFLTFSLNCLFFYKFGLSGLGYAIVVDNAMCLIIYYVVNRRLYNYHFSRKSLLCMCWSLLFSVGCFLSSMAENHMVSYTLMGCFSLAALIFGFLQLRSKLKESDSNP